MSRALITGASGFIGWHLARQLLAANHDVVGLVRHSSDVGRISTLDIDLRRGDLRDEEALRRAMTNCDTVFHLAGLTRALHRQLLQETNVDGTARLAAACADQANPPRLIYLSSLAAAGPSPRERPRDESDPPKPVSNYGRSKLAGEEALRRWCHEIPTTVIRPPIVFGEADPGMRVMFRALRRGRVHVIPGLRRELFSLIYAADLTQFCLLAAARGERLNHQGGQGIYFVESAQRPSYRELGEMIGRALGHRLTLPLPMPHLGVWGVGALADLAGRARGTAGYMSIDKAREATAGSWICRADKAREQLGFEPPGELASKLEATAEWYRGEGWL